MRYFEKNLHTPLVPQLEIAVTIESCSEERTEQKVIHAAVTLLLGYKLYVPVE
jgi:hypothetical protein